MRVEPRARIVSMYTDQVAPKDMSRDLAARHGYKIYPTVAEALTLGGDRLAVDAVLLIGEHGDYPLNERGQKMYPRHELLQQIVEVFRRGRRAVPVFSDKHLSYSWKKASEMYRWSRELNFSLMAGSSIPVTVRVPELELPFGCEIEHAVTVGYGDPDSYGFHTLESSQCMVERRRGGEKGVAAVEWIEGPAVWKWRDGEGQWSAPLLEAALATNPNVKPGRMEQNCKLPVLFLVDYRGGLRTAVYMLNGHQSGWVFSAQLKGQPQPVATHFGLVKPGRDLPHFDGLVRCIEEFFVTGRPVYPVERTLLVSGALDLLFESKVRRQRVETPELKVAYRAPGKAYFQRA
ncbi:MAG: hypothetical protein FJW34_21030 [Acidobacteria bacterium]|nr:hypothetical protein [Acidobacteriota bacterium]